MEPSHFTLMDPFDLQLLKNLVRLKSNDLVADATILSCGCVVSESLFNAMIDGIGMGQCPDCNNTVTILKPMTQLRQLYDIIRKIEARDSSSVVQLSEITRDSYKENIPEGVQSRRRSSSRKSFNHQIEQMDLISLFSKYAKEENNLPKTSIDPIDIRRPKSINSVSGSSRKYSPEDNALDIRIQKKFSLEDQILSTLSEEKEYNFSKCFPFHRKLTTFQTQQKILFNTSFLKTVTKTSRFISSHICTYIDKTTNAEITRFVLISEKRWELYEVTDHPVLICCGKLTGEYGPLYNDLKQDYGHEVIIRNGFSNSNDVDIESSELTKKLSGWEFMTGRINNDFLVISGTKGIMRVFNISKNSLTHELGRPVYTYTTDFPIRCITISPTDALIACSITAKERVSKKEQPFVIVHKLIRSNAGNKIIGSVEPTTITIPYRDPIKILNFNSISTHLICCTVWESRYLIIRLRSPGSDNFRKPRLIWTDSSIIKSKRKKLDAVFYDESDNEDRLDDDALMMDHEGITDVQFGTLPNTIIISSCSLQNRATIMLRLEGSSIKSSFSWSDNVSLTNSDLDKDGNDEDNDNDDIANIKLTDLLVKFTEVGFSIHQFSMSPRRDALVFLDKDGKLYLVSINHKLSLSSPVKKVVVLLGEVSNAERFSEAASIKFSPDGGKIYVADRRGNFSIFDFTKGIPGQDSDVVKCKIIM